MSGSTPTAFSTWRPGWRKCASRSDHGSPSPWPWSCSMMSPPPMTRHSTSVPPTDTGAAATPACARWKRVASSVAMSPIELCHGAAVSTPINGRARLRSGRRGAIQFVVLPPVRMNPRTTSRCCAGDSRGMRRSTAWNDRSLGANASSEFGVAVRDGVDGEPAPGEPDAVGSDPEHEAQAAPLDSPVDARIGGKPVHQLSDRRHRTATAALRPGVLGAAQQRAELRQRVVGRQVQLVGDDLLVDVAMGRDGVAGQIDLQVEHRGVVVGPVGEEAMLLLRDRKEAVVEWRRELLEQRVGELAAREQRRDLSQRAGRVRRGPGRRARGRGSGDCVDRTRCRGTRPARATPGPGSPAAPAHRGRWGGAGSR